MTATTLFSVTSDMISNKDTGVVRTSMTSAGVDALAQRLEYWVAFKTGVSTTPTDAATLAILQLAVIYETAIAIKNRDPHSQAIGSFRFEHYPQLEWKGKLAEIYRGFPDSSNLVPAGVSRWGD